MAYLYEDYSLRQALEKMEHYRYSAIPIIDRNGCYIGTMTEGISSGISKITISST
ncbi:MAG: CBS domain-containing protein [Lachnospiraceae bacterium]